MIYSHNSIFSTLSYYSDVYASGKKYNLKVNNIEERVHLLRVPKSTEHRT